MQSSLGRYTLIAKRWAWVVLLGVVICGSTTYIVTKLLRPVYQASTSIVLSVGTSQSTYDNTTASLEILPTYTQLVTSHSVLDPVVAQHPGMTVKQLSGMVTVKPQSSTQIIEVDVENGDPQLAAQLANEIAQSFAQFSNTRLGGIAQIQILPAQVPPDPVRPQPTQDSLIGALVGLGLAIALIVIFEWMDDRLIGPEEVNRLLGIDALTIIPALSRKQRSKNAEETPALAEGCRILCASLNIAQVAHPFKTVMVTSAFAGEGKSTIAANIASFLAMSGKRVLLVDADLRRPVLNQHFQLDNRRGFSNAFLELWTPMQPELEGQPTEIPSLRILTAGVLPSNPSELLQSQLAQQLFNHFKNSPKFDYVIFDTPPVLPIADSQILASYVQAAVLVVDGSKTSRKALVQAKQTLGRTGTRILGVAVNKSLWPDYGDVREYRSTIQQRPRADIAVSMPPNGTPPPNMSIDSANTAILRSANNR